MQRAQRVRELGRGVALPADRLITTSASTGLGVAELWSVLGAAF